MRHSGGGSRGRRTRAVRPGAARCRAPRHGRAGSLPGDAAEGGDRADRHADRGRQRGRHGLRPRRRRQRLRDQAVSPQRAIGPAARPSAPERTQRRGRLFDRSLRVPAQRQADDGRGAAQKGAVDRKGNRDPQIPLSRRRPRDRPRHAPRRGVGLQRRGHDAYARNPCLPAAAKDRARPDPRRTEPGGYRLLP